MRDVLRVGLVGAGMPPAEAHRKLVQYFDRRPPAESYLVAFAALVGAFLGVPGDELDVKKKTPTSDPTNPSPSQRLYANGAVMGIYAGGSGRLFVLAVFGVRRGLQQGQ